VSSIHADNPHCWKGVHASSVGQNQCRRWDCRRPNPLLPNSGRGTAMLTVTAGDRRLPSAGHRPHQFHSVEFVVNSVPYGNRCDYRSRSRQRT
jgi:hypothetical protein